MTKETGAAAMSELSGTANKDLTGISTSFEIREGTVLVMAADTIGRGDDQLGRTLAKSFLYTLSQAEMIPRTIIFLNSGVKLVCQDSDAIPNLLALEERGAEILSCGTCLDFYHLKDQVVAGKVSNMYAIIDTLTRAPKVINF
ncbi:sulfurtransferase-like selenium metabolism protein YedF [Heliobacterium chlorum]|uniref:Sulfurtransferase-like selenium metabolism protein YedF n=1 Tax=Heliobacterium chlorum TaxID=2698 RepID=A0ABR7T3Y4_HELCL|nr:sulfurtransferase-like selenium metabolism protein YedF [Heliobacterium chlorum]MBC9785477.1 sulfurtransferase-like selenium metabolism protein YedF [Heliobacterium chlorum]